MESPIKNVVAELPVVLGSGGYGSVLSIDNFAVKVFKDSYQGEEEGDSVFPPGYSTMTALVKEFFWLSYFKGIEGFVQLEKTDMQKKMLYMTRYQTSLHCLMFEIPYGKRIRIIDSIADQVYECLCYMHERGIFHGDIKPGNIMCEPPPHPGCRVCESPRRPRTGPRCSPAPP